MTDETVNAIWAYSAASKEIGKALTSNNGGKKAEVQYGVAYQKLVQLGEAPQLKSRYRP